MLPESGPQSKRLTPRDLAVKQAGKRLREAILARSQAASWPEAIQEWELAHVFLSQERGECACGHFPILEHCELFNPLTGNRVIVGNHCVRRFLDIDAEQLFRDLRRISKKRGALLSEDFIVWAIRKGWLTEWERTFYLDMLRWRGRPTPKQRYWVEQINGKVLRLSREVSTHA
jgi:hypothetical protein